MSTKTVSSMTKAEAAEYLTELGEKPHPGWTSLEIKARISEILKARGKAKVNLGISSNSPKKDMIDACSNAGVVLTGHETKGDLMRKLRERLEQDMDGDGAMIMTFGKHDGKSFTEIRSTCPGWCTWAKTIVDESGDDAHWKMRQFVAWLRAEEHKQATEEDDQDEGPSENDEPKKDSLKSKDSSKSKPTVLGARPKPTGRGKGYSRAKALAAETMEIDIASRKSSRRSAPEPDEDLERPRSESAASAEGKANLKMLAVMEKMAARLEILEQEKGLQQTTETHEKQETDEREDSQTESSCPSGWKKAEDSPTWTKAAAASSRRRG